MTVTVPGAELHYSTRGAGPTCLFPSTMGVKAYERQTPPPLTDHLRLVHVDLRGSGQSTGDPSALTYDVIAQDLEAVRVHLGVDRVAVLGHSILGSLAIEYGRRCPDSVSHVIAVGTPPFGDMARVTAAATAYFQQDASDERKRILAENLAAVPPGLPLAAMFAQTPLRFHDVRADAKSLFAEAQWAPQLLAHLMGKLTPGWDVTADPRPLRPPLLVAMGRHDYVVPHTLWDAVAPRLPDATVKLFERSGHQPFFEEPEAFAAAVTEWMGRPRPGRG